MTLDEAIRHETKVAEKYTEDAMMLEDRYALTRESCLRCAEDRKQIAEWLKELKAYRATYPYGVDRYNGKDEPQTDCYMCKWLGEVDVCGRCRNRNLFAEAEPQPRCPNCGKRGYIRSLESMGIKLKAFDEYKWKCTNCNKYFKEEPKTKPQTVKGSKRLLKGKTDCPWK